MTKDRISIGVVTKPGRAGHPVLSVLLCCALVLGAVSFWRAQAEASDGEVAYKSLRRALRSGPSDADGAPKGDLYALVVGVANYRHPDVPKLMASAEDAKAFGEFLGSQKKVFKNIYVKLLLNEQATKVEVEKSLGYDLLRAGKDDTVVLFFSGHGSGDPKKPGQYFFLGHDTDPHYLEATAIKMSGLDFLKGLDTKRVVLIADACHAGAFSQVRTKSMDKSLDVFLREFGQSSGRVILTSSKPSELSQEKPGMPHSVFTHYLLKGLNGEADLDRDGVVTLQELYQYVYERTKDETEGAQHPQMEGCVDGHFPMSIVGEMSESMKVELWVVAQDPRCTDRSCTDPQDDRTRCTDPQCGDISVVDGTTMFSGQNYQIAFRPSSAGYVYVYQIDAKGQIYKLFPGSDYLAGENRMDNPLRGGQIYWIPSKNAWLRHDDQLGQEQIYVVASRSRNAILENLYSYLDKIRGDQAASTKAAEIQGDMDLYMKKMMAPTRTFFRKAPSPKNEGSSAERGRSQELVSQIIESSGLDAAKSVSFWHRNK